MNQRNKADFFYPANGENNIIKSLLHYHHENVTVVSFIGSNPKATIRLAHQVMDQHVFQENDLESTGIQIFYDETSNIVYLVAILLYSLDEMESSSHVHQWLSEMECESSKAFLLLLCISHVVIVVNDKLRIDTQLLRLFRLLHPTKQNLLHHVSKSLRDRYYKSSYSPSKLVIIPLLLFVYPSQYSMDEKFLWNCQHTTEKKLRKLILSLPNTHYGVCNLENPTKREGRSFPLFHLSRTNLVFIVSSSSSSSSYFQETSLLASQSIMELLGSNNQEEKNKTFGIQAIQKFLDEFIQNVVNLDVTAKTSRKQTVVLSQWLQWSLTLMSTIFKENPGDFSDSMNFSLKNQAIQQCVDSFRKSLDVSSTFAAGRCSQMLPMALARYQRDLPSRYNSFVHHHHLDIAIKEFQRHVGALVPSLEGYLKKLKEEAIRIWHSGRRLCDFKSVTGRNCQYLIHSTSKDMEHFTLEKEIMEHKSNYHRLAACNCGRTLRYVLDPFEIQEANGQSFMEECCGGRDVLSPSPEVSSLQHSPHWNIVEYGRFSCYNPNLGIVQDGFLKGLQFLSPWEIEEKPTGTANTTLRSSTGNTSKRLWNEGSNMDRMVKEEGDDFVEKLLAYVGVEYECPEGHRFFRDITMDSKSKLNNSLHKEATPQTTSLQARPRADQWPHRNISIYIQCVQCKSLGNRESEVAQLMRLFLCLPSMKSRAILNPEVKFFLKQERMDPLLNADNVVFRMESNNMELQCDHFVCLRLPYVYLHGEVPILSENYRDFDLFLSKGLLTIAKDE